MIPDDSDNLSVADLGFYRSNTCGYCGPPGKRSVARGSYAFRFNGIFISPSVFQGMVDRGWTRSGTSCLRPDLERSCCPQYATRLVASEYRPSRSHRKVINRFKRFLQTPTEDSSRALPLDGPTTYSSNAPSCPRPQDVPRSSPGTPSSSSSWLDDVRSITARENGNTIFARRFEVTIEPPDFTEEKFRLYCDYQAAVHCQGEERFGVFRNFLCATPLRTEDIPYRREAPPHLPKKYGTWHQMYRLDGELIAFNVIDVLPRCIVSAYCVYNPELSYMNIGKLTLLNEISQVVQMAEHGAPGMAYLYLGYYVHSCAKMRYKATYSPSFFLDPEDFTWHPVETCLPLLDRSGYVPFANPDFAKRTVPMEGAEGETDVVIASPFYSTLLLPDSVAGLLWLATDGDDDVEFSSAINAECWDDEEVRARIQLTATLLGEDLVSKIAFYLD